MDTRSRLYSFAVAVALIAAALACGPTVASTLTGTVAPMTIADGLTKIDVCTAVPQSLMEQAIGDKLVKAPQQYFYEDSNFNQIGRGCIYYGDWGPVNRRYGQILLLPEAEYYTQWSDGKKDVSGLGDEAYLITMSTPNERILWVRMAGKVTFGVIGDVDILDETFIALGKLVEAAIR